MKKLIHLKDYSDIYDTKQKRLTCQKAYSTNSRMMGVVGIRLHFQDLVLFFHLDFEEYGFDRFQAYEGSDTEIVSEITQSFMGGLGSRLVEITLEEASALIYQGVDKGSEFYYDVPLEFFEYEYLLEEFFKPLSKESYKKITCKLKNDYERINYFLMRTAGKDYVYRDSMLSESPLELIFSDEPTLLLKNSIEEDEDAFICKSIIDYHDAYKMLVTRVHIENKRVTEAVILNELPLTSKEASFQLNKKEHILVCYAESIEMVRLKFENLHHSALKNIYEGGSLYTVFQKHNHHVRKQTYYLNEDVSSIVYFTDTHQIIIACFDEEDLVEMERLLESTFEEVAVLISLEAEAPIVYNFVNTGLQDFLEFIGE